MKNNCHNCKHLERIDADVGCGSGFTCNKRLTGGESVDFESWLLTKLEKDEYLNKSKRCCELIPEDAQVVELTCPGCKDQFMGYKRDDGSECFDCYAARECAKLDRAS